MARSGELRREENTQMEKRGMEESRRCEKRRDASWERGQLRIEECQMREET